MSLITQTQHLIGSQVYHECHITLNLTLLYVALFQAVGGDTPQGTSSAAGSVTSLVSLIFSPFLFIWHMIQTFLFATPQTLPPSNQQQQHSSGSTVLKR